MFVIPENIFFILLGYFFGSLTVVYYLVRRQFNSDVRDIGSGGVGATNVGRVLGTKGFAITFAADFSKGVLALLLAKWARISALLNETSG
jgi:glycerol-3-phosphate acyltransferase PlsY